MTYNNAPHRACVPWQPLLAMDGVLARSDWLPCPATEFGR